MMLREEYWVQEVGPVGAVDCSARDEYICWAKTICRRQAKKAPVIEHVHANCNKI